MRPLALLALFLSVYAGTTALFHRVLPGNEQPLLAAKLEVLEGLPESARPNLIFVGSSRAYHGFVPETFDRRTAELGHDARSFNLGITGLKLNGCVDVLRRVRKVLGEDCLRWVLIDPESPELLRDRQARSMQGVVNWYDPRTVQLELGWILKSDMPRSAKWEAVQSELHALAFRTAAVGRATPLLDPWLERGLPEEEIRFRLGPRGDGFRTKDDSKRAGPHKKHRQFLAREQQYEQNLQTFQSAFEQHREREPSTPEGTAILKRIEDSARVLGAEPVFVPQPALNLHGELRASHEDGLVSNLLLFNDPIRYPNLFEIEARWEEAHLSKEGAERFTLALADRFSEWLDAELSEGDGR